MCRVCVNSLEMKVTSLMSIHLSAKKSCSMTKRPCSPCSPMLTFLASSTMVSGM